MSVARFALGRRRLSLPALVSVSLGISAATILFTLIQGVLLAPLPYPDGERLVLLRSRNVRIGEVRPFVSVLDFQDWRRHVRSFEGMALYRWLQIDLPGEGGTERVQGLQVTPEFFDVVGLTAHVGRLPDAASVTEESHSIVLSRGLWRRRFGEDARLVGKTIEVNSWRSLPKIAPVSYRVLAVVGELSRYLPTTSGLDERPVGLDDHVDFWLPTRFEEGAPGRRELRGLYGAVARLATGVTALSAQAELETMAAELSERHPDTNANWSVAVVPLTEAVTAEIRPALWLLFAGVALLLAISCSNVASLQLVRTFERHRELVLRKALGASSFRLVQQIIVETLVLVVAGGTLGVVLSVVGLRWLKAVAPPELPRADSIVIDGRVLLFTLALAVTTALLTSIVPAWHASKAGLAPGRDMGWMPARGSQRESTLLHALASFAIAMSLTLLIGAGLLEQSVGRLLAVDPGYDRRNVLTMTVSLPEARYTWHRNTEFVREVIGRLSALPGVDAVGGVRGIPGRETRIEAQLSLRNHSTDPSDEPSHARIRVVTPTYFRAMGIPLLTGRGFEAKDESGVTGFTKVVLVNETFAQRFWPGESAIGQKFGIAHAGLPSMEIVGVVGDVRYRTLDLPPGPEIYYPEALFPQARTDIVIRTRTDPMALRNLALATIRELEPDVLITDIGTVEEVVQQTVRNRRFAAWLLSVFSFAAFLLAVVGVGGVVARNVALQRRDIGVRVALGAQTRSIIRMVLGRSLKITGAGVALGLAIAATATQLITSTLYGIEPTDGKTYFAASLFIVAAATLTSYFPARSAARTDPLEVLRHD